MTIGLLVGLAGCQSRDDYLLGPDNVKKYITLDAAKEMDADGVSEIPIAIQIPDRSPGALNAVFTTTAGKLVATGKVDTTVTVPISTDGTASALLRSDSTPGSAEVRITVGTVTLVHVVTFKPVSSSDLFTLSANPTELDADGYSRADITVVLKRIGDAAARRVIIETAGGALFPVGTTAAAATPTKVELTADQNGVARVQLESELVVRTATVTATAFGHAQSIVVPFRPADPSKTIRVSVVNASPKADFYDFARITAQLTPGVPANRRTVTFRTNVGEFQNGQNTYPATADVSGMATADLKSRTAGVARVTASIDGASADTSVSFGVALPTRMVLTTQRATVRNVGDAVQVRVMLLRDDAGKVTLGLYPDFSATRGSGGSIGQFVNLTPTNNDGLATADFSVGDGTFTGPITITVSVAGSGVSQSVTIQATN